MGKATSSAQATRDRLIAAAATLFTELGYENATLAIVGAQAGVTGPALYRHFNSKEDLLKEVLVRALTDSLESCRLRLGTDSILELRAVVGEQIRMRQRLGSGRRGPATHSVVTLVPHLSEPAQGEVQSFFRAHLRLIRDLLQRGIDAGDFRPLDASATAFAIMGLCDAAAWLRPEGRLGPEEVIEMYSDLAYRMVSR